ncbi:hypothetical protein ABVT39_025372 [Epinephelus coioides]
MDVGRESKGEDERRTRGGSFCIAPGCSNEFYRLKEGGKLVHFHVLPMRRPQVMRRWLSALKRDSPPVGAGLRVCSDHFLPSDYVEEGGFDESGRFVRWPTNRLKPDSVPSVFDFSQYSVGETDRPLHTDTTDSQKRASQAEEREVVLL